MTLRESVNEILDLEAVISIVRLLESTEEGANLLPISALDTLENLQAELLDVLVANYAPIHEQEEDDEESDEDFQLDLSGF